ncbi:MAG: efflux RND transporter permease subunit, partial [Holophagae bacterium]
MKIVDIAIRRPVTVFIFSVAAVVFGLVAFRNLAVNLLPDISYPSLTVRTTYEGTAPVEIESLITRPVENAVGVVNNVVRVTSSSRADVSEVTLEFAWDTNMDFAALDVRDRLDRVRLPMDAELPVLLRFDPSLDPIMRV